MTEQPPSAEAMKIAMRFSNQDDQCAAEIDTLCEQRVAAETERWQNRDRQRLGQIDRLQETVQSLQSARDERPQERNFLPHNQCPSCYWHPGHEPAEWFAEEAKIRGYSARAGGRRDRPAATDPLEQTRQSGFEQGIAAAAEYVEERPNEQPAVLAGLMRDLGFMYAAERPAPEGPQQGGYVIEVDFDKGDEAQRAYDAIERLLFEMGQIGTLGMRPPPSAPASTGERPASPAAVVDYTERAREIIGESCGEVVDYIHGSEPLVNWRVNERLIVNIAAALSAAASERDAAAIRAFGKRVRSDTEEIAYQAGVNDTRARLREPDVREAVATLLAQEDKNAYEPEYKKRAASIITKIAEMLK